MSDISEEVETTVIRLISEADVDTLVRICEKIPIEIPAEKAERKVSVVKLLLKYLHSDTIEKSEDEGLSTFLMIQEELTEKKEV